MKRVLFSTIILFLLSLILTAELLAEEITVVRGGEEALQTAIQNRTRSGPSAGFASPLPSKKEEKTDLPAPEPRPAAVSKAVLVPYGAAGPGRPETSAYDKSLELSPPRRFSRDLDRHDSFEDELAQSTLKEVRDGYTVDEGEQSSRDTGLI